VKVKKTLQFLCPSISTGNESSILPHQLSQKKEFSAQVGVVVYQILRKKSSPEGRVFAYGLIRLFVHLPKYGLQKL